MSKSTTTAAAASFLNSAQLICLVRYAQGEHAHLLECADKTAFENGLAQCGDGLLRFLIAELASQEDCTSMEIASTRIMCCVDQLSDVYNSLISQPEHSPFEPAVEAVKEITLKPKIESMLTVRLQDLVGPYDQAESVPEWHWIERMATFKHIGNGTEAGVWEYVVFAGFELPDIPQKLQEIFEHARSDEIAYILFYQG